MKLFLIYAGKELPEFKLVEERLAVILNRLIKTINEIPTQDT